MANFNYVIIKNGFFFRENLLLVFHYQTYRLIVNIYLILVNCLRVTQNLRTFMIQDCVLQHVSAHGLHSVLPPTSLKAHNKMDSNDKAICNAAYAEEYDGLESLPTWEVISEDHYKQLSKGKRAHPTMAIATIKYDENNCPKRAKYRLVVLVNLDYHTWSKESTAAPVLSQLELRLLTSLAVYHCRVLKNCDVK
jgi:hypothetical protein